MLVGTKITHNKFMRAYKFYNDTHITFTCYYTETYTTAEVPLEDVIISELKEILSIISRKDSNRFEIDYSEMKKVIEDEIKRRKKYERAINKGL